MRGGRTGLLYLISLSILKSYLLLQYENKYSAEQIYFRLGLNYFKPDIVDGRETSPIIDNAFLTQHAEKAMGLWMPLIIHLVSLYFTEDGGGVGKETPVNLSSGTTSRAKSQKKSLTK